MLFEIMTCTCFSADAWQVIVLILISRLQFFLIVFLDCLVLHLHDPALLEIPICNKHSCFDIIDVVMVLDNEGWELGQDQTDKRSFNRTHCVCMYLSTETLALLNICCIRVIVAGFWTECIRLRLPEPKTFLLLIVVVQHVQMTALTTRINNFLAPLLPVIITQVYLINLAISLFHMGIIRLLWLTLHRQIFIIGKVIIHIT